MSDSLWVRTPGGIRVATDEVLALLEWLESYHRRAQALCDEMARSSVVAQVRPATEAAHSLEEWSRWMVRSLDVYSQQVAAHEKARSQLFELPRDRALSTLTQVALGRTDLPGDIIGAHSREGYEATAQRIDESPAQQLQRLRQSFPHSAVGESAVFREREG